MYSELWTALKESNLLLRWIFEFTKTEFRHLYHLFFFAGLLYVWHTQFCEFTIRFLFRTERGVIIFDM